MKDNDKQRVHGKKKESFEKLFLMGTFPAIVIALLALLTVAVFIQISASNQHKDYLEERENKLKQISDKVSVEIKQAEKQQLKFLTSSDVKKLIYSRNEMTTYEYYQCVNYVEDWIGEITGDNPCVKRAFVCFDKLNLELSEFGPTSSVPLTEAERHEAKTMNLYVEDGSVYCVRSLTDYDCENDSDMCSVIVEIDMDYISKSYGIIGNSDEFVYLSIDGKAITAPDVYEQSHYEKIGYTSPESGIHAVMYINYSAYGTSEDIFHILLIAVICILAVLTLYYSYFSYFKIYNPLKLLLVDAFSHLEKGDLDYRIAEKSNKSPFNSIYSTFNSAMSKLKELVDHVYQQKLLISQMNLKQLQAQINPHFMYNTYYTLYRLIGDGDQESSKRLAKLLGDFYKYITRTGTGEKTLSQEVSHTVTYVEIQSMRFPDTILEIQPLNEKYSRLPVPQLILQPVFENVFQHVQKNLRRDEPLHLKMTYAEKEEKLLIIIENNGELSDEVLHNLQEKLHNAEKQEEMTGLINIHRRLQLFYGEEYGITASKSDLGGLRVVISIMR